jgi:hypothetical protein
MISGETKIGRVMLLQRGKTERKVIETELGDRKPKYGASSRPRPRSLIG